ncbi:MAG TPA: DEAD/DEAH box helicase [Vicinamibacterales bacterium]|nr:DEAD/DEAH box helicase [Vicinamibacterales bacterium]
MLQLMTRRAMVERPRRGDSDETLVAGGHSASETEGEASCPLNEIPEHWRLVPEGFSLYGWQRECLPLWLARGRGTVKVATGGGKTLFALMAAQQLQNEREPDLRLAVVVPTIPLLFQWYDDLRRGNVPESAIGLMGGGYELPPASSLRILVCVLNSARDRLAGYVSRAGWSEHLMLVVDECHRSSAEQARRIFDARPKYTLGLSATPEQDVEVEGLPNDKAYETSVVGQALGPIIYDFTIRQSLAAGLLTPFEVWHIGLSLAPAEANEHARLSREISELRKALQGRHRRSHSKQGFLAWCQTQANRGGPAAADAERFVGLANRRKRLLYRAKSRTDVTLAILSESARDPDARTIVFHESIGEIERLFLRAIDMQLPAVLEHSQLPESLRAESIRAFRQGIARVIISAKSLVEGFNVPSADFGIIVASSGSVRQRIQSLGRMLRRKPGARTARIVVLFIRDTEDEAIYEKADWESIVGAERNRYFRWNPVTDDAMWSGGLVEMATPPRTYRPPSSEIDVADLHLGETYPGQTGGMDLRVDQSGNVRGDDGALVAVPAELVAAILERNVQRRARLVPAGHLIVRVDSHGSEEADWRFLGTIALPADSAGSTAIKLRIKTVSGRRVIAREDKRGRGTLSFALGPGSNGTVEAGVARDRLLDWTRTIEASRSVLIRDLYWDGFGHYWLEVGGQRIEFGEALAPLEFDD